MPIGTVLEQSSKAGSTEQLDILRLYEDYCYQIAFYLLENVEDALVSTKSTLLQLGNDHIFLSEEASFQKRIAKDTAIRVALNSKREKLNVMDTY